MVRTGYHLVDISPWPLSAALSVLGLAVCLVGLVNSKFSSMIFCLGVFCLLLMVGTLVRWWSDIVVESTYLGLHTRLVVRNLRLGMILFIVSEVFFFIGFFWGFFNASIGEASMNKVGCWPPLGIKAIYPWKVPALNTIVLVGSGATVTWAHKSLKVYNSCKLCDHTFSLYMCKLYDEVEENEVSMEMGKAYWKQSLFALGSTIALGIYFTWLQYNEYYMASFTMADGVYGSTFYIMTGFHGVHVLVGTVFLLVCWFRTYFHHFGYNQHHFGFDAAVWYWHFVDVVWIGLFGAVYVWGYY